MLLKARKVLGLVGASSVVTMGGGCDVTGSVLDTIFLAFQIADVWA